MHKIIKIVTILFSICILWIIYLANTGTNSLFFSFIKSIPLGDKFGHFFLFGSLTYLLIIVLKFRAIEFKNLYFYYGALLVMTFVIIEEFSQNYFIYNI